MSAKINATIEPLIKRKIFNTEEEAIRELLREYILRQIAALRREAGRFDRKYGMRFEQFSDYQLLTITGLTAKVIAGLGFRIQLTWEYDNEPAPGTAKSDTELSTALTYTLGS